MADSKFAITVLTENINKICNKGNNNGNNRKAKFNIPLKCWIPQIQNIKGSNSILILMNIKFTNKINAFSKFIQFMVN